MTYEESLLQKGEQRGVHDTQQKIAFEMLRDGDSAEKVAKCTHLALKDVEKLQKQLSH